MENTTIIISVRIATANKYEGMAEARIPFQENHLKHIKNGAFSTEMNFLIHTALEDYEKRNA